MGEVKLAMEHCKISASHVVFDSPAKTFQELHYALVTRPNGDLRFLKLEIWFT